MFIVITGLDGSGTSTLANQLSKIDTGSSVFRTPSDDYSQRDLIDKNVREFSQTAHYLYYLSSVVYISDIIRKFYNYKDNNIYCVRYLIDTVVSHQVAGLDVDMDYSTYNILEPDLTIFVQLEESIRNQRISARGKGVLDKLLDDAERREKFLEGFKKNLNPEKRCTLTTAIQIL